MNIKSMTGFSRVSIEGDGYRVEGTLSSVNGKGSQVKIRLPEAYRHLEIPLKKQINKSISRGTVNLALHVHSDVSAPLRINKSRLHSFLKSIQEVTGVAVDQVGVQEIVSIPDIFIEEKEHAEEVVEAAVGELMKQLLSEFDAMRSTEGLALEKILRKQLHEIKSLVQDIRDLSLRAVDDAMAKIQVRVQALLAGHEQEIAQEDMLREIALLAERCDITEELDRLDAHIPAFVTALKEKRVGKKLDFILQEMNRETNTTGSKTIQVAVSQRVIEIKSRIEAMREQSLNIE